MKYIDRFTADPIQKAFLTGNGGERIALTIRYIPTQKMWMADFQKGDFVLKGVALVCSPNLLRGYKNIISFGLNIQTLDGQDPRGIDDWVNGYAFMYLLNQQDVLDLEDAYFE